MFFSVSMPVYNAEKYLNESISSVIDQTEKDFELILVDDGSKDNSLSICRQWEAKYPDFIRVVEKENSGSLLTRRRCLTESKGDYLYVIDADDRLVDHDVLKKIREEIERSGCDLLFFKLTTDLKDVEGHAQKYPFENHEIFAGEKLRDIYRYYLKDGRLKSLCTKVFHRSLVDWDESYEQYSFVTNGTDYFQSTPILSKAKKMCFLDEALYCYRIENNENSLIHSFKPSIYVSARENLLRVCEFSKSWGLPEKEREDLLRAACMKMASTSAFKLRLNRNTDFPALDYLKRIGEDELFRKMYDLSLIKGASRKIIVFLLYHRRYSMLLFFIRRFA